MTEEKDQNHDELEKCRQQCEEYLNNWKRERADFINYKRDESKRMEELLKFSNEGIIMEAVEIIDDFEQSFKVVPESCQEWAGVIREQVLAKFIKFLETYGIERIKIENQEFDPAVHEAVEVVDQDGKNIEEIRAGYKMHGRVIRPARVKIIK